MAGIAGIPAFQFVQKPSPPLFSVMPGFFLSFWRKPESHRGCRVRKRDSGFRRNDKEGGRNDTGGGRTTRGEAGTTERCFPTSKATYEWQLIPERISVPGAPGARRAWNRDAFGNKLPFICRFGSRETALCRSGLPPCRSASPRVIPASLLVIPAKAGIPLANSASPMRFRLAPE